jgi:hypothetical protein
LDDRKVEVIWDQYVAIKYRHTEYNRLGDC